MKVLMIHSAYQEPGGEGQVFQSECSLLEARDVELIRYTRSNAELADMSAVSAVASMVWNRSTYQDVREIVRARGIDVVHCHNTFPFISPAVYWAAKAEGAAVVQTLHNYRLTCLNGLLFRDGAPCEDCIGKRVAWSGIRHACYRSSAAASAATAGMLAGHRALGTYQRKVDRFIALTPFARQKMIQGGLDERQVEVKQNFLEFDPQVGNGGGGYALFVGRLSREKGLETLLEAWRSHRTRTPLRIVGDGELRGKVGEAAERLDGVEWLGRRPFSEVMALMANAAMLIVPSLCYEGNPRNIIEAFGSGTPVIASRLGGMQSMVETDRNGVLFEPGDAGALARAVESVTGDTARQLRLRAGARESFEKNHTADANYSQLMRIYAAALARNRDMAMD